MQCYIYRSSIKEGLYVYLAKEDGLETLPEPVLKQLGTPEFSMTLDLHPDRKLGQEDARVVLDNLESRGFHVQMPRDIEQILHSIAQTEQQKYRPDED
ncbi:YcgL domain-containing protein [Granulosicoccus sp. 3-233]|uniref:YcgL domain-containing protein n=1 Tax=Granulosicoccus sp. 3-233 TaxID=3417969 RepID=UPI003D355DD3